MYNLSSRFSSSGKGDKKGPDRLALCIVLQYTRIVADSEKYASTPGLPPDQLIFFITFDLQN